MKLFVATLILSLVLQAAPALAQENLREKPSVDQVKVDPATQELIAGALKYMASQQSPSGAWNAGGHDAGITAYVLLAFLSTGNLPGEGEYGQQVARGTQYLLDCVRPDGYIAAPTGTSNMYGHGIASIVLGEIYGQTKDPNIRPKLERAIKLIIAAQSREGGWRYNPRPEGADISVTVLQVVALRVAKNSGLDVPQETIDRAVAYVKKCCDEKTGGFYYQPGSGKAGFARTAAAIYSLQVCGLYDDPMVKAGSDYIFANHQQDKQWFTYGHLYAAPAHYMMGGEVWAKWYKEVCAIIIPKAIRKGDQVSWTAIAGSREGGNVYATAAYTMILAMPYHYLPLYQR